MKQILIGALSGDGVVTDLAGREVQTVRLEYFGQWSMGHDALHLDELRIFADGRTERRNWAIQVDARGKLVGYDTDRRARVRAEVSENRVRLVYDAPMGGGTEIAGPRTVIDLRQNPDGSVSLEGRAKLLGLPYRRTRAVLQRLPEAA
ncbi:DUF3833 family protein [Phenylobacterium montanum]|uniref:DUF3833 family protein n=1 Tax=Phenylobacterium montanum TaxID=2823693 RepID=A0A975FY14_9CAUL|nr:DUF3833 family protein [Caulobacter sp. S6]QUD87022.1 DUF3833 family protein [Caulobacter sp. S6]